ncbi:MAG: outer membrane protein assembly factor BamA [Candidatus Omnitrophica bacterium]|nr:outer membrane protein assembly factor BamA [Candidatus Omnitrophota bacterium]
MRYGMFLRPNLRHSFLRAALCLVLSVLLAVPVWCEEGEFKVTAVEVEGNTIVSSGTILSKIKTRPGDTIRQAEVDEDIKRLYATGFFIDVSAETRSYQDGQLIRFRVKERPLVSSIVITGNRHFRENKIREELGTKEQELLDRRQLKEDLDKIRQLYRTKGFYLADISSDVKIDEATNRATVFITVTEGKKIRVRRIRFSGNEHISSKRLRKAMSTKQGWWFTAGYYRPEVLEDDEERLKALYRSEGYSDVRVDSSVQFDEKRRWLTVSIIVEEGPLYLVGNVLFRGVSQLPEGELAEKLKLRAEEPFSQDRLAEDVAMVQSAYFAKGFMAASVDPTTALNPATNRVDVTLQVEEGAIYYVGEVLIRGNTKTRDTVIRRELLVSPGERFDGDRLRRSKERLYNLGYFEEVTLETVPSEEPQMRDLVVSVKESKTGEFSFGGGFSSVDSFIGFAEITQRNFDLFNWPTFTGGGQELKFSVLLGTTRKDFELSFTEPWVFDYPYLFGFDLFQTSRIEAEGYSFDLRRRGGDLRLGKRLGDFDKLAFLYRLERVEVSNVADTASAPLLAEVGTNTISAIRLAYTRDIRDNVFNPTSGYLFSTNAEVAGSVLGGDKDFWRWTGTASYDVEPFIDNQVLELRANLGIVNEYGDSDAVPIFERFFAGGADSIRGYQERRVGPKDVVTNDPVGGEALAVFNAEYTVPFADFLKGAIFYDVGNVWADMEDFGSEGFKSGAGAGVRVKTPFGPVKLDYGFPINPDKGERKTGRVHFSASRSF